MAQPDREPTLEPLDALVGEWSLEAVPPGGTAWPRGGRVGFEWLEGRTFLIERWAIDLPEAPDGIAIIGATGESGTLRRHYFDSRGVHRMYEMSMEDGIWRLWRDAPDPFPQRFSGSFSDDGRTIAARWEKQESGSDWETDFDLTYRKVG